MTFFSKIKWVASILLVFLIVLITNIVDRKNFNQLSESVTTMYEDRIVANDLIFEMSRLLQEKQLAAVSGDTSYFSERSAKANAELKTLLDRYAQTKLTNKEKRIFGQLQEGIRALEQAEAAAGGLLRGQAMSWFQRINKNLYDLSKIQVEEGKRQVFISNQAKDTINLFTQGEIIFLILMAIVIQVIILYKPKAEEEA